VWNLLVEEQIASLLVSASYLVCCKVAVSARDWSAWGNHLWRVSYGIRYGERGMIPPNQNCGGVESQQAHCVIVAVPIRFGTSSAPGKARTLKTFPHLISSIPHTTQSIVTAAAVHCMRLRLMCLSTHRRTHSLKWEESLLQNSHQKIIMIVKISGSSAAAEEGGEVRGGRRGESGESKAERSKSTLESTVPKARSRSRTTEAMNAVPRVCDSLSKCVGEITVVGIVVIIIVDHHRVCADISMLGCNIYICAYIGFLVGIIKAKGWTTSRGTWRGAVIQCLTLCRQVETASLHLPAAARGWTEAAFVGWAVPFIDKWVHMAQAYYNANERKIELKFVSAIIEILNLYCIWNAVEVEYFNYSWHIQLCALLHLKRSLLVSSSSPTRLKYSTICMSVITHRRHRNLRWILPATDKIAGTKAIFLAT